MFAAAWLHRIPWTVVFCALALMLIGLTGIERGDELSEGADLFERQVLWILISVPTMFAATTISYRLWKPYSHVLFAVTLPLLVLVFFLPARNGSHSWIRLGPMNFQPSELAKLGYILATAHYLMYRSNYRRLAGLVVPFLMTCVPVGLVLREPDLGTALLFIPVLFAMLFAAGARWRHLALVILLGVCCLPLLWMGMNAEQRSRITSLFHQTDGGPAPRGDAYQQHQGKQMLALGGVRGSEFGGMPLDDPFAYHLPASQTDFVYCLVGERWGLIGGLVTLLLYLVLFARGLMIAAATREPFGRLVAVGIVALLAAQTIINTGMTVGLMPVTGITLPLMSYGGSSLLATCVELGLLMNIAMRPGYEMTPEPFRFRE